MPTALLIDGENISCAHAPAILKSVPGDPAFRRVYGDATRLNGWSTVPWASVHHVPPGPNATDMAMMIDAVALAHRDGVRDFTLATGDADFLPLLKHLRETGASVRLLAPPNTAAALKSVAHHVVGLADALPRPVPKDEGPLATVKALVRAAGDSGLPMAELSRTLQRKKPDPTAMKAWLGHAGPRAFLEAHAACFDVDAKVLGARVRLRV
jgi:hypothetical protein